MKTNIVQPPEIDFENATQSGGIARSFRYLGLLFTPWEMFSVPAADILNCNDTPAGWCYIEFYEIADQHAAGDYTMFLVKGKMRVPGTHFLYHYNPH